MTKAIFYKEWIKLRTIIIAGAVLFVAIAIYLGIGTQTKLRVAGAAHLIDMMINKDANFIMLIKYLPAFFGLSLGLFQFIPEMNRRSLKLTLHLPISESRTITSMMLFCITTQLAIYFVSACVLFGMLSTYLPIEITNAWAFASIPWVLAGFASYLLCCWVCIEPLWKQRIINGLAAFAILNIFLLASGSYGFQYFNVVLVLLTVLAVFLPFYSVARFKEGVQ